MKNLHLILVNKAKASLYHCSNTRDLFTTRQTSDDLLYEVYITSDEEIKEGDHFHDIHADTIHKAISIPRSYEGNINNSYIDDIKRFNKIILTTDQDLIKDGVQAIDDEFLQWFVKNPLCEEAEVVDLYGYPNVIHTSYKMVIPSEEPKQETLEEAAEKYGKTPDYMSLTYLSRSYAFIEGAKWQQERMYSREDMINFAEFVTGYPDKNRNQLGQILHAKSRYDGAERTSDLLMIWADLGRTAKDQTV